MPSHSVVEFLTQDPAMLSLLEMVGKIAPTEVSVLILGESGTGKEVLAKRIHQLSKRSRNNLVSVNCGAVQDTLLLSELFGHEKGSFTGAHQQKRGLVEVADGGTLFLDEIAEMGMEAQAKLLRFLQEGEFFRVGGQTPIKVDVRILSATNKDLNVRVREGSFREDLFYRLNTVALRVAPLRKRPDDIPLLIQKFLSNRDPSLTRKTVSRQGMEILSRYSWPGNVRELQNVVERFKILVEGDLVQPEDIPFNISNESSGNDSLESNLLLDGVVKKHIYRVLEHFKGNKTKAANAMGITVKTLYNKLARYSEQHPPH